MNTDRFLRRHEVEALTGLSKSSIYRLKAEGKFVQPYRLGKSAVRWSHKEVLDFINATRQPVGVRND